MLFCCRYVLYNNIIIKTYFIFPIELAHFYNTPKKTIIYILVVYINNF